MSKLGKICAYLGVFILLLSAAALSIGSITRVSGAETTENKQGGLSYEYIMTTPVAVDFSEAGLFVLDGKSQVVRLDQNGMTFEDYRRGATKLAVGEDGGSIITNDEDGDYADALSLFADGEAVGAIMPKEIYVGKNLLTKAVGSYTFLCGDAYDGKIYVCEQSVMKTVSVYSYDLSDGSRTLVRSNVKTDGVPVAMTVLSEDEIYYATDYSLFTVGKSLGEDIGGITSLSNDGDALYYTTRSGKLQRRVNGVSRTVMCAAESVSAATRKNFAVFTDRGNNKVTVISESGSISASVEQPLSSAIDYNGNIHIASGNEIREYSRNLEEISVRTFGLDDEIIQIKIDPSDVVNNALYVLTASGRLFRTSDKNTPAPVLDEVVVSRFEISQSGNVFALTDEGNIVKCVSSSEKSEIVLSSEQTGGAVDFSLDVAENVFCATETALYKNGAEIVGLSGVREIDVSLIETRGKNAVGYGDIIVISEDGCGSGIIKAAVAGTDMGDGEDEKLDEFIAGADEAVPNAAEYALDIRKTTMVADIYDRPAESPKTRGETAYGTYVIVIEEYPNTDYVYAIIEAPRGSFKGAKGFINRHALSDPVPLKKLYEEEYCRPLNKAKIFKYPSTVSPVVDEAVIGQSYAFLDFVYGYRDGAGRGWCRVAFEDENGRHEGYMLRGDITTSASTGGDNKVIVPDAYIKAGKDVEVGIYELNAEGEYVSVGVIEKGTEIQLEEPYRRNNEYTKITYFEDEDSGALRTCYVKTEYIKLTVGSWYQVIMFVVGGIVIAAIIIIAIVAIKKRKKIEQ